VTTAHHADDVRIFERQCRSLADTGEYDVSIAGPGNIPPGSTVTHLPLPPISRRRLLRFLLSPLRVFLLARRTSGDVWHIHDPELIPVALWLAKSGKRVIWDAHEDYLGQVIDPQSKTWIPGFARTTVRKCFSVVLNRMDERAVAIVAATPVIASRYQNLRTVVVGNEVRLEPFRECSPTFGARRLLFTGHVNQGHLFSELVKAVMQLPDIELAVAGRFSTSQLWLDSKTILGDRLIHLGWLDRKALSREISLSTLGVVTYIDNAPYAVGLPTKLFEFAAAGLPVVATPNPLTRSLIEKSGCGFVAEGFTHESLKRAITKGLSDKSVWLAASVNGRHWARTEGNWESSEKSLLALYRDILRN